MLTYSIPAASRMAFGVYRPPLPVSNVPEGATVARIRCRPGEFVQVYLRRGKSFECWYCDVSESGESFVLTHPVALNHRPAA